MKRHHATHPMTVGRNDDRRVLGTVGVMSAIVTGPSSCSFAACA